MPKVKEAPVVEEPTEVIEPAVEEKIVSFGTEDTDVFTFVQRPLSFFGKMDFFAVMGRALDRAMSGPDGISIADILDTPENTQNLREADTFIRGIAKIAAYAPETLLDLYCVILAVPRGSREYVKQVMELPHELGGLTDEQGIGILNEFVDQNWEVLVDFFSQEIMGLVSNISKRAAGSQ